MMMTMMMTQGLPPQFSALTAEPSTHSRTSLLDLVQHQQAGSGLSH